MQARFKITITGAITAVDTEDLLAALNKLAVNAFVQVQDPDEVGITTEGVFLRVETRQD